MNATAKPTRLLLLGGAALLTTAITSAQADVFRVPRDFATIDLAMAKASDLDVILVEPGIYDGFVWGEQLVNIQAIMGAEMTWIVGGVTFEPTRLPIARRLDGFTITGAKNGLLFQDGGGGHIVNCSIVNNDSSGVRIFGGEVYLENCLIANNNQAQTGGCGLLNETGVVRGVNLTVYGNIGTHSAGICDYSPIGSSSYANCIIWNNGPAAVAGNARFNFCNSEQWVEGFHNMCAEPCFVDPVSLDFALAAGSPCIDAGDNSAVPVEIVRDIGCRGRFIDDPFTKDTGRGTPPIVDLGAFEYQVQCSQPTLTGETSCPQGGPAVIMWTDATPKAPVLLLIAAERGVSRIPAGSMCGGAYVPLAQPLLYQTPYLYRSDSQGSGRVLGRLSNDGCGRGIILLDTANCSMSKPVRLH